MIRFRMPLMATSAGAALTTVGLLLIVGCGDETGLAKRYPVSGTVTYQDKPVAKGQIHFLPTDPKSTTQREANGFIENGHFTLTTATPGDGALPGPYHVTITAVEIDTTQINETVAKYGGGGRQQDIAKATKKAKSLVPPKYQLPETSELKATVKEGSNTFEFKLTD
jgi:hypothetical protein